MKREVRALSKCKIHKGDEVIVIAGQSKNTTGTVDKVDYKKGRVYVGGANIYKKHQKRSEQNPEGGIIEKVMPLDISNVALVDPKTKKATRVGYRMESGKKVRFAKASGSVLS